MRRLEGQYSPITAAALSPDTRQAVTVDRLGEGILWNLEDGQRIGSIGHSQGGLVVRTMVYDLSEHEQRLSLIEELHSSGTVPDLPIGVDATVPEDKQKQFRERITMATAGPECQRCHKKMDPLGLPFEMYNHAGLFRTTELGKPVETSGEIIDSGDPSLDGPVEDALDMIAKLAESERAEQVFVRHAFRFWMGRNETLNDAPVLQAAHQAYRDSGGSMKALITSLLTSDAFLYRKIQR